MATRALLISALVILAAISAIAQGSIGFGPQLGIYKSPDADGVNLMGGAALRLKFSPALGVEASINYRQAKYGNGAVDVKSWPVMVTGLFYPFPVLYGAVGAGWYNTTIDYSIPSGLPGGSTVLSSESKQQFGWHFGGGLEIPLGPVGKLVGDIRYVFLNYNFKTFPGSNGVSNNFVMIAIGLLFGL